MSCPSSSIVPVSARDQAGDDVEAGRLAGAVGAEQTDDLAALHRHADVAHHRAALEALAEPVADEAAIVGDKPRSLVEPVRARHSSAASARPRRASRVLVLRRGRLAARRRAGYRGRSVCSWRTKRPWTRRLRHARGAPGHHAADVIVEIHDAALSSDHILATLDDDVADQSRDPGLGIIDTEIAATGVERVADRPHGLAHRPG